LSGKKPPLKSFPGPEFAVIFKSMKWLAQIALLMLLALPCRSEEPSEEQLLERMTTLGLQLERLEDNRRNLDRRRVELSRELARLSERIEREKQNRPLEGLLPAYGLEADLRQAKSMAEEIEQIARLLSELEAARQQQGKELALVLEKLIELKLAALPSLRGEEKSRELGIIEKLRRQHADLLGRAPVQAVPSLPAFEESDDLEQLREQADAVADAMDRLRRRLSRLEENLSQARAQLKLERRLWQFVSDQELFAESRSSPSGALASPKAGGSNETLPGGDQDGSLGALPGRDSEGRAGPDPRADYPEIETSAGRSGERIETLEAERRRLIEELKQLQMQYDRLQEQLEKLQ
jgi:hypothetical protein